MFTEFYEFRYSTEWLGALFRFVGSGNYLVRIFDSLYNDYLGHVRFALFIDVLCDFLTTYDKKFSLRVMNYKSSHAELNNFDLLKKMFLELLEID